VTNVKKLTGMGEVGQSSKYNDGNFNQIWYMDTYTHENAPINRCEDIKSLKKNIIGGTDLSELDKTQSLLSNEKTAETSVTLNESPEVFSLMITS
jgi:hypothetical protein